MIYPDISGGQAVLTIYIVRPHTIYVVTTIPFFIKSPEEKLLDCPKYRDKSNSLVVFSFPFFLFFFFITVDYWYDLKQQDLDCGRSYIRMET